jgi:hypothetical protein
MTHLFADFNALDEDGRVWLPSAEYEPIARGDWVLLFDGDVEVEAQVFYDDSRHVWIGVPNRSTLRPIGDVIEAPSGSL